MLMEIENIQAPAKITNPESVAEICRAILSVEEKHDQEKEHLWVFGLTTSNRIKYIDLVTLGTLTNSLAHPREIFRMAVMQGVAAIILAHNHPGDDPKPSKEDIKLTQAIQSAGEILGIPLLDHVIVTWDDFWSANSEGIIKPKVA
jgi:DNA repair protein RadC